MKATSTWARKISDAEKILALEQQLSDLQRENAELSCDGTQAREALTRARARIEELERKNAELKQKLAVQQSRHSRESALRELESQCRGDFPRREDVWGDKDDPSSD